MGGTILTGGHCTKSGETTYSFLAPSENCPCASGSVTSLEYFKKRINVVSARHPCPDHQRGWPIMTRSIHHGGYTAQGQTAQACLTLCIPKCTIFSYNMGKMYLLWLLFSKTVSNKFFESLQFLVIQLYEACVVSLNRITPMRLLMTQRYRK